MDEIWVRILIEIMGTEKTFSLFTFSFRNRPVAEWLEHLPANANFATVLGSIPNILRKSGILGAEDEAVWNMYLKIPKKSLSKVSTKQ